MSKKTIPSKMPLTLSSLPYLSEAFASSVNKEIEEALRDCNNRPRLKKPRKLKFEIAFVPVVNTEDKDNELMEVDVKFIVFPVGRPQRIPEDSRVNVTRNHQGFFHADFPDDPNAIGLFDDQAAPAKK